MRTAHAQRTIWGLFLATATLLAMNGCPKGDAVSPDDDEEQVTVTLENLDVLAVHVLGEGESFPTGRLEQGEDRFVIYDMRPNEETEFRAGRNGSIISTKKCKCTSACDSGGDGTAGVEWTGSALACKGW